MVDVQLNQNDESDAIVHVLEYLRIESFGIALSARSGPKLD